MLTDQNGFHGKRVVVTGGARDTGYSLASILAALGADIVIAARKLELAQAAAESISGKATGVEIDLSSPASIEMGCRQIVAAGSRCFDQQRRNVAWRVTG